MEVTECGARLSGDGPRPLRPVDAAGGAAGALRRSRDGVKASKIVQAAKELGMTTRGARINLLRRVFELRFPMIVHWNANHFVVLEGLRGNRAYISDPAAGPRTITTDEFEECFSGTCLTFEPSPEFRKGGRPSGALRGLLSRLGQAHGPLLFVVLATLASARSRSRPAHPPQGLRGRGTHPAQRLVDDSADDWSRARRCPAGGARLAPADMPRAHGDQARRWSPPRVSSHTCSPCR